MPVTITKIAALIDLQITTGGGSNSESEQERASGSNGVLIVGGVWYVLGLDNVNQFIMYSSTDEGISWRATGSAFVPSIFGGGLAQVVNGTDIVAGYVQPLTSGLDAHLKIVRFDTLTDSWSAEQSFNFAPAIDGLEGPYAGFLRSDGNIVWLLGNTVGGAGVIPVIYTGAIAIRRPTLQPALGDPDAHFESAVMGPDDTVHVFYYRQADSTFWYQSIDVTGAESAPEQIAYTGQILDWNGNGLNYGFIDSGTIFLACGLKTADYPVIWGRPAILFGSAGAWTMSALLDTDLAYADYSIYMCTLNLAAGFLIYTWRGISSDGSTYIERVGYAPQGSHNTPGDWTWQTVYNYSAPVPTVPTIGSPYQEPSPQGSTMGITQYGDNLYYVTSVLDSGAAFFATYLFTISATVPPALVTLAIDPNSLPTVPLPLVPLCDSTGAVRAINTFCFPKRLRG